MQHIKQPNMPPQHWFGCSRSMCAAGKTFVLSKPSICGKYVQATGAFNVCASHTQTCHGCNIAYISYLLSSVSGSSFYCLLWSIFCPYTTTWRHFCRTIIHSTHRIVEGYLPSRQNEKYFISASKKSALQQKWQFL
jgi:hypothetical protein